MAAPPSLSSISWGGTKSTGWKDVTLKLSQSGEELKLPVMISTKVSEMKVLLGESIGMDPGSASKIEFLAKVGISMRKLRNNDEIRSHVVVKNLPGFTREKQKYPHPYVVIGAGHFGLRQAMHYVRHEADFLLIDRHHRIGGNAWVDLANDTSCTQSEGVHYQLCYDPNDGGTAALKKDYGCWPSRAKILAHFEGVCDEYGVTPHLKLSTNVDELHTHQEEDWTKTRFELVCISTDPNCKQKDLEVLTFSNVTHYPGAMVEPRVGSWPGEADFGGQLEYAHGNLFDYSAIRGQRVMIIGFGAFANENIRTSIEFGVQKIFMIARHLNVFLPRCVCWLVNQSINAPPGSLVFRMMEPIYQLIGWDVYEMPTVITNKDRTSVMIRQNARWGTGDIFFLSMYFGIVQQHTAEVKRFKHRAAVLTNGAVLTDIDHVMKCLGFSGDFSVDKLHKVREMKGFWPDGDWRRWLYAEFLQIDAQRFSGTAFGPGGCSVTAYSLWFMQHPMDALKAIMGNMMPTNTAKPELGKPAYDWPTRNGSMIFMMLGGVAPELADWESTSNTPFKKASIWHLQYPEKHVRECTEDWERYSKLITELGYDKPWPKYPYKPQDLHDFARADEELNPAAPDAGSMAVAGGDTLGPARLVLLSRSRSPSPRASKEQVATWLTEAKKSVCAMRSISAM